MAGKESSYINKTPDLANEVEALRVARGLSKNTLARQAHTGHTTLDHLINPNDPTRMTKARFTKIATVLTDTVEERRQLLAMAGIDLPTLEFGITFAEKVNQGVAELDLNPVFRDLLEASVLAHIQIQGPIYKQMQSMQESILATRPRSVRRVS